MTQQKIDDLIIQNFTNSVSFLADFFDVNTTDFDALSPFVKVLAALRGLPREAMDDIVHPVMAQQMAAFNLNPKNRSDRKKAEALVDLMALSIQDATNMIMQVMEQQQYNAQKLRSGQWNLIT